MKHAANSGNSMAAPVGPAACRRAPSIRGCTISNDPTEAANESTIEGGGYRELPPPPQLADLVLCFWYRGPTANAATTTIVPDGCVDIIWRSGRLPVVAGPMTVAIHSVVEPGSGVLGIRLRPGVAGQTLGLSARDLRDRHLPLRDLWSARQTAGWETIPLEGSLPASLEAIAAAVSRRRGTMRAPDRFAVEAAVWLAAHPFGPVDTLYQLSGLSERQARRRFDEAIGYGPKLLQRVLRLQYLLWLASHGRGDEPRLARLAHAAGYADQPHMTREVAAFTGASPREILLASAPHSAVSGLFRAQPHDAQHSAIDRAQT